MDAPSNTTECPRCRELEARVKALEQQLAEVLTLLAATQRKLAETEAKLAAATKNSSTSSKPPSSDIVKPSGGSRKRKSKRKRGAQPGHPRHSRPLFGAEQVDQVVDYHALDAGRESCPDCGGTLELLDAPAQVLQQLELVVKPVLVVEHRGRVCRCGQCHKEFSGSVPRDIRRAGLIGPELTALVGYLKGVCHCSFTTIQRFLSDIAGVKISRGQLRKVCGKVATSLDQAYAELLAALPHQDRLNVDETGHKENGQGMWTWCFRAPLFTLFRIDPSRGSEVLVETLGAEFDGVLGCDYFSAYRKYMRLAEHVLVQFCLAHLIRDVRFLVEHPDARNRAYGRRLLKALKDMFAIIHGRDQYDSEAAFLGALEDQGYEVCARAMWRVPSTKEARNLANRFREHGREYIRFITTPGVAPTNNLAEQAIRFVVLDRKVTQGTRSAGGRRWCERIWTAIATCAQHGASVFRFLSQSIQAHFGELPGPSLLPAPS